MKRTNKSLLQGLDFSGSPEAFFNLWHNHVDWDGEGNQSWEKRKFYLDKLISSFEEAKSELMNYPIPFQCWLWIDENDSSQDAIYIHTVNPNEQNFPIEPEIFRTPKFENKKLEEFITQSGLHVAAHKDEDGFCYYLWDPNFGVALVKDELKT